MTSPLRRLHIQVLMAMWLAGVMFLFLVMALPQVRSLLVTKAVPGAGSLNALHEALAPYLSAAYLK